MSELEQMTEFEFLMYIKGYQNRQVREWEKTRFIAWMVQATQTTKPLKIEEVLPLPIDEERKKAQSKLKQAKKVTKTQYDSILNLLGRKPSE